MSVKYGGEDCNIAEKYFKVKETYKQSFKVKVSKGGRDSKYSYIRFPPLLADKYSLNQECVVEIIDREDLGGIVIKKSN